MDLGIAGRRAAVAAASQGLGLAVADGARRRRRARSRSAAATRERIDAAAARIGRDAVPLVADVSTDDGAAGSSRDARDALGGVDILVRQRRAGRRPGNFATTDRRARTATAFELNCLADDRDVLRGGARRCGSSSGGRVRRDHVDRGAPADRRR